MGGCPSGGEHWPQAIHVLNVNAPCTVCYKLDQSFIAQCCVTVNMVSFVWCVQHIHFQLWLPKATLMIPIFINASRLMTVQLAELNGHFGGYLRIEVALILARLLQPMREACRDGWRCRQATVNILALKANASSHTNVERHTISQLEFSLKNRKPMFTTAPHLKDLSMTHLPFLFFFFT